MNVSLYDPNGQTPYNLPKDNRVHQLMKKVYLQYSGWEFWVQSRLSASSAICFIVQSAHLQTHSLCDEPIASTTRI